MDIQFVLVLFMSLSSIQGNKKKKSKNKMLMKENKKVKELKLNYVKYLPWKFC